MVIAELKVLGWTRMRFADELNVSKGSITGLLKEGAKTSRLVVPICDLLGLPMPNYEDAREQELFTLLREIREADPQVFDRIEATIRRTKNNLDK